MIETFLIWKITNHYPNTITFSNGASGDIAVTGGQGATCEATVGVADAVADSNDYIIVSFHFIIQIFYDCVFRKKASG